MQEIPISICMLTGNNGSYLEQNLQKLRLSGCELVIIDMGNSEQTKQIAGQYADRFTTYEELQKNEIYKLPQEITISDEGAVRNAAALLASHDWILTVEPEESLSSFEGQRIYQDIQGKEPLLGRVSVTEITGSLAVNRIAFSKQNRLYHRKYHRYQGLVYPGLVRIRREEKHTERTKVASPPFEIIHKSFLKAGDEFQQTTAAYLNRIKNGRQALLNEQRVSQLRLPTTKADRAMHRIEKELARLFYLEGACHQKMENWQMAVQSYEKALLYKQTFSPGDQCRLICSLSNAYCKGHQEKTALELMERNEILVQPGNNAQQFEQSYYLTQGNVYLANGNMSKAREYLEAAVALGKYDRRGSDMIDTFQKLKGIYQALHMDKEAEHCTWEQIRLKKKYDILIRKVT